MLFAIKNAFWMSLDFGCIPCIRQANNNWEMIRQKYHAAFGLDNVSRVALI